MPAKAKAAAPVTIELEYNLAELPSSQHRAGLAGLAGLVLMIDWLNRQRNPKGICEVAHIDERGAKIRLDQDGLKALLDELYAATREEQSRPQLLKNSKTKEVIPPLREVESEVTDEKTGKTKKKISYIYPIVVPKGGLLVENDPTAKGDKGDWVKLWRDMTWSILRGVPATRAPFDARADKEETSDAADIWEDLVKPSTHTIELPSTYYIGAQASNAENVPFKDRARFQFLLHFWSYVAGIYIPAVINNEGGRDFVGYALAIPDVAELKTFTEELPRLWQMRGVEMAGYRPRDAVIDLAVQGALDMLSRLRERVAARAGANALRFLVLGVDVIHVEKQGKN
ncbi:MAG: type I-MYXAN CRISPR-associated protein Cmx8, partial [Acidobacteriota bacterium]|nr:type I-MYXAN CRISPR-associated protein Cmx8 [Acidobacteriota bacterium]